MFRPVRKKANEIDAVTAEQLLIESRRGVLSMNGENGYPYAIPINYFYDQESKQIYFHGSRAGYKIDMLKESNKVCFVVLGDETIKDETESWAPYMKSAMVFGTCRLMDHNDEAMHRLKQFAMKYYPSEDMVDEQIAHTGRATQIFVIHIEHISGKEVQEK